MGEKESKFLKREELLKKLKGLQSQWAQIDAELKETRKEIKQIEQALSK